MAGAGASYMCEFFSSGVNQPKLVPTEDFSIFIPVRAYLSIIPNGLSGRSYGDHQLMVHI